MDEELSPQVNVVLAAAQKLLKLARRYCKDRRGALPEGLLRKQLAAGAGETLTYTIRLFDQRIAWIKSPPPERLKRRPAHVPPRNRPFLLLDFTTRASQDARG